MKEILSQVRQVMECPVLNCSIGALITVSPFELMDALENEESQIKKRNIKSSQYPRCIHGCGQFSTEGVIIFYNKKGEAISYELPYIDPNIMLDFTLRAELVEYGWDPQSYFVANKKMFSTDENWDKLLDKCCSSIFSIYKVTRSLFPPDKIVVDDKEYEIAASCICDNYSCVLNNSSTKTSSNSVR